MTFNKRIAVVLLAALLLLPCLGSVGCALHSQGNRSSKGSSMFNLPKKGDSKPKKVRKDKDVPVTMGDWLSQERNDVL